MRSLSIFVVLIVLLLATACATPSVAPTASQDIAELRIGLGAIPASMDTHKEGSLLTFGAVYRYVFDGLLATDSSGKIQPALAVSYKLVDNNTWEFKLRDGVTFHNGEKFDAAVAKWNLDYSRNPDTKSLRVTALRKVKSVDVVDPRTIRIITSDPDPDLPFNLVTVYMLPEKYYQEKGPGFNTAPIGSGPYRVKEYQPESRLVLERAEKSWRPASNVKSLVFRHLPEDASRVAALEAGELDLAYAMPLEQVARLEGKGHTVVFAPIGQSFIIQFRQQKGGPIADKRVRQALSHAINVDAIVKELLQGKAEKLQGQYVGADAFGYNSALKAYPFDQAKAKQLLAEAGFGSGLELTLSASSGRYLKDVDVVQAVVSQFKEVGVNVKIEFLEAGRYLDKLFSGNMGDMYNIGFNYAPSMNAAPNLVSYTCAHVTKTFCGQELEAMLKDLGAEMDSAKRDQMIKTTLARMYDDPVAIYLFRIPGVYGHGKGVSGITFRADYGADLANVKKEAK